MKIHCEEILAHPVTKRHVDRQTGCEVIANWPLLYIQDGRQPPSWIFEI